MTTITSVTDHATIDRRGPAPQLPNSYATSVTGAMERPHVVIIGAGFGGLSAALALRHAAVEITVIERHNYHLFQPLLYQVATAGLSPAQIATPVRGLLRDHTHTAVLMERVEGVDLAARQVMTSHRQVGFDYLIVATGARHAYFGHDDWEPFAPGLKKIEDATAIRRKVLTAFERAESSEDPEERKRLLTFVVIGGGPTGVELAGAIAELARTALARDFRRIDPGSARVILVEAAPRLLLAFPERLSRKAERQLMRLGAEVRTNAPVTACNETGVTIGDDQRIDCHTVLWAAGVAASPAARWLGAEHDRAGRVMVGPDLSLPGDPHVFVIGDTALSVGRDGKPVPGVAPAAKQMGRYVGKLIGRRIAGRRTPPPFIYKSYGNLATIGRKSAVAEFGKLHLSGYPAWLLWSLAHVYFLIGFRNRIGVMIDWAWSYATFDRGARLITDSMP
jgi:NADH:quinone reductase (non-electrogenic)